MQNPKKIKLAQHHRNIPPRLSPLIMKTCHSKCKELTASVLLSWNILFYYVLIFQTFSFLHWNKHLRQARFIVDTEAHVFLKVRRSVPCVSQTFVNLNKLLCAFEAFVLSGQVYIHHCSYYHYNRSNYPNTKINSVLTELSWGIRRGYGSIVLFSKSLKFEEHLLTNKVGSPPPQYLVCNTK